MIHRESVRRRLEEREHGISYTEFSYMILQAYDFLHLRRELHCTVQIAGSDQFGNIVSGIDLIRREFGPDDRAFGITAPLVTKADGRKIGKTESGAIWLSPEMTSPFAFYQYWINTADEDIPHFLRWFTFLDRPTIEDLERRHAAAPHEREAQKTLARQMTRLVHGPTELDRAEAATQALFGGDLRVLDAPMLAEVFADVPSSEHAKSDLEGDGLALVDLLPLTTLASSKREARQFLESGAVSVNGDKVGLDRALVTNDLLHGTTILLKRGRKHWHATRWA
jgi:tyrosyl-tRNA synthetase